MLRVGLGKHGYRQPHYGSFIMAKPSVITKEFKAIQAALQVLEPLDETQRKFAVSMILTRLGMAEASKLGGAGAGGFASHVTTPPAAIKEQTVKQFLKQKDPKTDLERFICLAYYLSHAMDTATFTTRDITKLNGEGGGANFSNAAGTANNGVAQSKFLSRAGGGKKRITNRGEAVVEALPDRAKLAEVLVTSRAGKKRGRRKRTKTSK